MKKVLLASLIAMVLFACNNSKSSGRPEKIQRDTTQVLGLYLSAQDGEVAYGLMQRVVIDSFTYIDVDTLTKQKKWAKDTSYIITYMLPIDSATSKRNGGIPITDSLGRKILYPYNIPTLKKFVASGWDRADSTIANKLKSQR